LRSSGIVCGNPPEQTAGGPPVNETAEGRSIAVIATRMPYIDRRSLSEAWFSALHLASDGAASPISRERRGGETAQSCTLSADMVHEASGRASQPPGVVSSAVSRVPRSHAEPCLQTIPNARRGRSEAVFARARSYAPFRTALTLGVDGERVALLLRREGATLHVVALCRPAVADLVRRALACADLHLRARGEVVTSRVETRAKEALA
jgi:hypothetical protein